MKENYSKPNTHIFRVDKVIKRGYKNKKSCVWKGNSDDFKSWVPLKDMQNVSVCNENLAFL